MTIICDIQSFDQPSIFYIYQMLSPSIIRHDLERNIYYKIDKTTGIVHRAHKNGKDFKYFKVDVTGNDYKNRRNVSNHHHTEGIHQIIAQKQEVNFPRLKIQKTPSVSQIKLPVTKSLLKASVSKERPNKAKSPHLKNIKSELRFLTSIDPIDQTGNNDKHKKMDSMLRNYSQLKEQKVYQNHSIMDRDSGVANNKRIDNKLGFLETKNQFYNSKCLKQLKRSLGDYKHLQNKELRQTLANQIMKQKRQFLQFNPKFIQKQNERMIKIQVERKKNNKKLQQQSIKQNQKMTSQIYDLYYN